MLIRPIEGAVFVANFDTFKVLFRTFFFKSVEVRCLGRVLAVACPLAAKEAHDGMP